MKEFPFETSFWFDKEIKIAQELKDKSYVDVAVIGGGFAGLSSARSLKLKNPNLSVALIEAKHIGFGASGRNAGWISSFPPLYWLLDNFNNKTRFDEIKWATYMSRSCTNEFGKLIEQESIECNWTKTKHFLIARNALEEATLQFIMPRFISIGAQCDYYNKKQVQNIVNYPARAAIAYDIVTVQPYSLAKGLRDHCIKLGVEFFEHTHISKIERAKEGLRLTTATGTSMTAGKVILATNAYTKAVRLDVDLPSTSIQHTYMLATAPLELEMINRINQTQKPFGDASFSFYIGRIHNRRLIWNGVDRSSNATKEDDQHLPSYRKLYSEMINRFPFLKQVELESAWAGPFQQTSSDAPIVRLSKDNPDFILNIGYGGGSGINMALLSGQLTSNLVLGTESDDRDAQKFCSLLDKSSFPVMGAVRTAFGILKRIIFS
jgi:gamma-glutamylputrescine oxidase